MGNLTKKAPANAKLIQDLPERLVTAVDENEMAELWCQIRNKVTKRGKEAAKV